MYILKKNDFIKTKLYLNNVFKGKFIYANLPN